MTTRRANPWSNRARLSCLRFTWQQSDVHASEANTEITLPPTPAGSVMDELSNSSLGYVPWFATDDTEPVALSHYSCHDIVSEESYSDVEAPKPQPLMWRM